MVEAVKENKNLSKFKILACILPRSQIDYRFYINQQMIDYDQFSTDEEVEQISETEHQKSLFEEMKNDTVNQI